MRKPTQRIKSAALHMALAVMLSAAALAAGASASGSYQDLTQLIMNNEDDRMTALDLAFLLVTHNFDAEPKGDHVEVEISGFVYNLTPNADRPGLADILQQ
jgi:hypothetical protein